MNCVLDASAALEIAFSRKKSDLYSSIIENANWVIAPDLFVSETTNVIWKYHCFQDIPINLCKDLLDQAIALVDDFINATFLYQEAFAFASQAGHPVYDMLYLVAARRYNATLLTEDKQLIKFCKKYAVKIVQ